MDELRTHLALADTLLPLPQAKNGGFVVSAGGSRIAASCLQPRQAEVRLRVLRTHVPKREQQLASGVVLLRHGERIRKCQPVGQRFRIPCGRTPESGDGAVQIAPRERLLARCLPRRRITLPQRLVRRRETPCGDEHGDCYCDESDDTTSPDGRSQTTSTQRLPPSGPDADHLLDRAHDAPRSSMTRARPTSSDARSPAGASDKRGCPQRNERTKQPVDFGLSADVIRSRRAAAASDPDRQQPAGTVEPEDVLVCVVVADVDGGVTAERGALPLECHSFIRCVWGDEVDDELPADNADVGQRSNCLQNEAPCSHSICGAAVMDGDGEALVLDFDAGLGREVALQHGEPAGNATTRHGAAMHVLCAVVANHPADGDASESSRNVAVGPSGDDDRGVERRHPLQQSPRHRPHVRAGACGYQWGERAVIVKAQ